MNDTTSRTRRQQESHLMGLGYQLCGLKRDLALLPAGMPADYENYLRHELAATEQEFQALYAEVNPPEPVEPEPASDRPCPWFRTIRRFYGIARQRGMDLQADERMRGGLSQWLGRSVKSRSELTAAEWHEAGDAVERGLLCW